MASNVWTANRRLYLDKAGRVVEADDPNRASLLVPAGGALPLDRARELGLLGEAETLGAAPTAANDQATRVTELEAEVAKLREQLEGATDGGERKPGPDDPEGAFAYLEGETAAEGDEPKARTTPANKAKKPAEDK
jgi:hypothetical protein